MSLSNRQLRHLRGLTHHLKPVVMVGDKGLSENVMSEIVQSGEHLNDVIRVYDTKGMQIYSDIVSQRLLCL